MQVKTSGKRKPQLLWMRGKRNHNVSRTFLLCDCKVQVRENPSYNGYIMSDTVKENFMNLEYVFYMNASKNLK